MSEKHEWVSDDLCLIEKTTGVKFYGTVCTDMEFLGKYMNDLINENEQLKQFKEEVFNKIDMHLQMLPTARDREFNDEYGDPNLYTGAIYMLETLKKEL